MTDNDQLEKLEKALSQAENGKKEKIKESGSSGLAFRAGSEILAGILVGFLLGNQLDEWLETDMIFTVVLIILGFFVSLLNIYRTMK